MDAHVGGQRLHLLVESMPASDLKGNKAHLPWTAWHRQRTLDPAHVQHVDSAGAQRDGPADRDGMDQAAIEVMFAVDLDRRQQPWYGAGRQHGRADRPAAEPARAGMFDAGRNAVKGQLEIGEVVRWKRVS